MKQALLCDQCEERSKAVSYCSTCSEYLCEECLRAHKRLKAYRSHDTVSTASKRFSATKHQSKKSYNCSVHPNETLKLYCKTCSTLACILCFVSSHNGHDIGSIDSKTRKEVEAGIRDLVKETDSKLTEFEQNFQYISAVEKDKSEQSAPLKAEIDEKVDSLITQLETRRAELHKEIDDAITRDQKGLWAEKEYHETTIVSLKGALSFARRSLKNCKEDTELLALNAQITARLKELSQLKWESQLTEKIETTKLGLNFTESMYPDLRKEKSDPKLVGEVYTSISEPTVQLGIDRQSRSIDYQQGCSISFQITATVTISGKKVSRNIELVGSATYTQTDYRRNSYYGTHRRNQSGTALTHKDTGGRNRWNVTLNPPGPGSYYITFYAKGKYGNKDLCNQCSFTASAQELRSGQGVYYTDYDY